MALSSPGQAATVDLVFKLNLDGMSTGTCAGMICPTPLGTVTVTGDTTGSLDFSVALAPDMISAPNIAAVAGQAMGSCFYCRAGGNPIAFALGSPTSGTIGGEAWNWVTPSRPEVLLRLRAAYFPRPYAQPGSVYERYGRQHLRQ